MAERVGSLKSVARAWSRSSHSPISLDSPYGDSGRVGFFSVTVPVSGVPKTAALEEKTILSTWWAAIASSRVTMPVTFWV